MNTNPAPRKRRHITQPGSTEPSSTTRKRRQVAAVPAYSLEYLPGSRTGQWASAFLCLAALPLMVWMLMQLPASWAALMLGGLAALAFAGFVAAQRHGVSYR